MRFTRAAPEDPCGLADRLVHKVIHNSIHRYIHRHIHRSIHRSRLLQDASYGPDTSRVAAPDITFFIE